MKKKIVIIISISLIILIAAALLIAGNSYRAGSRKVHDGENTLIFSINVSDGKAESTPFVKCYGHAWISLDNQSGHSIYLMDKEIQDNEVLTFSTWAISSHMGVTFNLEPSFINQFARYPERKSVSIKIDESKLSEIEKFINENDRWTLFRNCTYFSVKLWNLIAGDENEIILRSPVYSPGTLAKAIDEFDTVRDGDAYLRSGDSYFYVDGKRTVLSLCE